MKVLVAGVIIGFLTLVTADRGEASTAADQTIHALQIEFAGPQDRLAAYCHHQAPKKHRCQRQLRPIAAIIEPIAKRKQIDFIEIRVSHGLAVASRPLRIGFSSDGHLRLNFNDVYGATRRMHI
jgi:hypothetical protein